MPMIGLSLRPRLRLALRCTVCRQFIDGEEIKQDRIEQALFGVARYARCCSCDRTIPLEWQDNAYRQRFRRFEKRRDGC